MNDIQKFYDLLSAKDPLCAMLAPSYVVDFSYPDIVWKLRKLGFDKVTEVTFGASITNNRYYEFLKNADRSKTWISSPCPTLVQLIKKNYPHLVQNLVPVHSPVGCQSIVLKKVIPDHKIVFIGPCITKKSEGEEIGTIDLTLTYKEIQKLFDEKEIPNPTKIDLENEDFDEAHDIETKIYACSGGLKDSFGHKDGLDSDEKDFLVDDGIANIKQIFDGFDENGKYRDYLLLDVLFCMGGCINGPGIINRHLSLEERRAKVFAYRRAQRGKDEAEGGIKIGRLEDVEGMDFSRKL